MVDFEKERLPFADDSVDAVFSSHAFEHIRDPKHVLNEIVRVCKNGAEVEIWTPYGHSNEAFVLGHHIFYNELIWEHFVLQFPDDWFDRTDRRMLWHKVRYNLCAGVEQVLQMIDIPIGLALRHLNNIAWEFGVYLEVAKDGRKPTAPKIECGYGR